MQATLEINGDITFAYKTVPVSTATISVANHRVFVGLSDSYHADTLDGGDTFTAVVTTKGPCTYDVCKLFSIIRPPPSVTNIRYCDNRIL